MGRLVDSFGYVPCALMYVPGDLSLRGFRVVPLLERARPAVIDAGQIAVDIALVQVA